MEQIKKTPENSRIHRSFTILIAELSPLLGKKITDILSNDESVLWAFPVSGGTQLLSEAEKLHPDLILADLRILKTPQTVVLLRQLTPLSRIVALTESESEPYVKVTTNLGLDGMIEKGRIGQDSLKQVLELAADKAK